MRKAILVALGVIALTAYACCRLAGEETGWRGTADRDGRPIENKRGGGPVGPPPHQSASMASGNDPVCK